MNCCVEFNFTGPTDDQIKVSNELKDNSHFDRHNFSHRHHILGDGNLDFTDDGAGYLRTNCNMSPNKIWFDDLVKRQI